MTAWEEKEAEKDIFASIAIQKCTLTVKIDKL